MTNSNRSSCIEAFFLTFAGIILIIVLFPVWMLSEGRSPLIRHLGFAILAFSVVFSLIGMWQSGLWLYAYLAS